MQGDGELQQWLHETGKDIGKMVGTHLKKAAKDKAVSYAQEQLGLGLADELGMSRPFVQGLQTDDKGPHLPGVVRSAFIGNKPCNIDGRGGTAPR